MPYIRITAADAYTYRVLKKISSPWEILVRAPESQGASALEFQGMLEAAASVLK